MSQEAELANRVRQSGPLIERLRQCQQRIGRMCSEGRPPRMTVPVQWDDDDWFICRTLDEAMEMLSKPEAL